MQKEEREVFQNGSAVLDGVFLSYIGGEWSQKLKQETGDRHS